MGDTSFPEGGEITPKRYKDQIVVSNHGSFMIGSKHGVEKAAVGREPCDPRILDLPKNSSEMLGVRLRETAGNPKFTSRLQMIIGKDEQGTLYIENMSQYVNEDFKGVPIKVSAPHFPNPVTLMPKGSFGNPTTRCPLGGTINALKDLTIKWGDESKGAYFYNLSVNRAGSDLNGWEARIRFDVVPSKR